MKDPWGGWAARFEHRIRRLPVVALSLNATCDSRCVACDYWKLGRAPRLGLEAVARWIPELLRFRTRTVLLTGGEPLVHSDLPRVCRLLREHGLVVLVHTNGLRLRQRLEDVGPHTDRILVSLDGAGRETYRRLRGVDGLERVLEGIRELRRRFPGVGIGSRTVLMKGNLHELEPLVELGIAEGLTPLSFLGVDVHSSAFARDRDPRGGASLSARLPDADELAVLEAGIDRLGERWGRETESRIEGGLASLRRIHARYRAMLAGEVPGAPECNAPWYSAVIEADRTVKPCFFQPAYGTIDGEGLDAILNRDSAIAFRRDLDIGRNELCRRCVCSKRFSWWRSI